MVGLRVQTAAICASALKLQANLASVQLLNQGRLVYVLSNATLMMTAQETRNAAPMAAVVSALLQNTKVPP